MHLMQGVGGGGLLSGLPDASQFSIRSVGKAFQKVSGRSYVGCPVGNCDIFTFVWFQELYIPPPQKGFFLRSPHLSGKISSQVSYLYLNFWASENLSPLRNFQPFLWREYRYFLELHIYDSIHRQLLLIFSL